MTVHVSNWYDVRTNKGLRVPSMPGAPDPATSIGFREG